MPAGSDLPDATEVSETAVCAGCGTTGRRADMFGAPPDLRCEACAEALRARYDTRLVVGRPRLRPPVVTALVAAVAGVLFLGAHALPGDKSWLAWLREIDEPIRAGEVWRFVTSAFLHAGPQFHSTWIMGLLHVGFNVWWVVELGRGIEGRWGHWAMLSLILGGAVGSSVPQWVMQGGAIGLSGVVYALAGYLFALRRVDPVATALMNPRTANALLTWFVICILLSAGGNVPIGNWAHGAGAVWGFGAGWAARVSWRRIAIPVFAFATAALVAAAPFLPLSR